MLPPVDGQDHHGVAIEKPASASYQVTPDRRQRLLRAWPDGRQIYVKALFGSIVGTGQTVPARTKPPFRDVAGRDRQSWL
jgi:hypothetical protein